MRAAARRDRTVRPRGRRTGSRRRRRHQHLLSPDGVRHHGVLGPEFRQGRKSGTERVEEAAAAHARKSRNGVIAFWRDYVEHAKSRPGVRFVTARELPLLYESQLGAQCDRDAHRAASGRARNFSGDRSRRAVGGGDARDPAGNGAGGYGGTKSRAAKRHIVGTKFRGPPSSAPRRTPPDSFARTGGCRRKSGSDRRSSRSPISQLRWRPMMAVRMPVAVRKGQSGDGKIRRQPMRGAVSSGPFIPKDSARRNCWNWPACRPGR